MKPQLQFILKLVPENKNQTFFYFSKIFFIFLNIRSFYCYNLRGIFIWNSFVLFFINLLQHFITLGWTFKELLWGEKMQRERERDSKDAISMALKLCRGKSKWNAFLYSISICVPSKLLMLNFSLFLLNVEPKRSWIFHMQSALSVGQ